jgi:hypothetical protein
MKAYDSNLKPAIQPRAGFTLVEMLVSVTLVLLMMTMFATIFQIATGSMHKQRGIAELDQKARVISTVVRKDFQHRTFRNVLPFYPDEDSATSPTSFSDRAGYIYVSTNNPDTGLDDLIQFTVSANVLAEDQDSTPYFGRAAELSDRLTAGAADNGLHISPNQPEADDGSMAPNSVASSPNAEICYFVRNGDLYRSVVLIREPLPAAGQNFGPQPTSTSGYNYLSGQPDPGNVATYDGLFKVVNGSFQPDAASPPFGTLTNDFYLLFDFSAHPSLLGNQSAVFVGSDSLSNETSGAAAEVLANPGRRFGFNHDQNSRRSREHTVVSNPALRPAGYTGPTQFFGRFTRAETSSLNFNWPQNTSREELVGQLYSDPDSGNLVGVDFDFDGTVDFTSTNGNPLDLVATPLALNPKNGVISSFDSVFAAGVEGRGGERRVEDLLLANVHEMKVELWDARLQRFVVPGHSSTNISTGEVGDYALVQCHNPDYVPDLGMNSGAVFDTWHPTQAAFNSDGIGGVSIGEQSSPYIPYVFYPPVFPNGPTPPSSPGPFADYWAPGGSHNVDDIVVPEWSDGNSDLQFSWDEVAATSKFQIGLRCVAVNDINTDFSYNSGLSINFPTVPGRLVTDGEITWESFDNRRPLEAIRLTFRFQDKTSDNMRQLSLVIPLTK